MVTSIQKCPHSLNFSGIDPARLSISNVELSCIPLYKTIIHSYAVLLAGFKIFIETGILLEYIMKI